MPTPPIRVPGVRSRWRALGFALAGAALALAGAERAAAFNLEDVAKRAKRLAAQKYREPERNQPSWLREMASGHPKVESARARFVRMGPQALEIELFAYVRTRDWDEFVDVREQVLLGALDIVGPAGAAMG